MRWIGTGLLLGFLMLQLVPVERTNPPVESEIDAPEAVEEILRRACFDCHSHRTRWPWYSRVAPVSWFVTRHVEQGRGDLNFSRWPVFDLELQRLALEDIREQVSQRKMPLRSYTIVHATARLSDAERERLVEWARGGP